jgi:hypothetical protein
MQAIFAERGSASMRSAAHAVAIVFVAEIVAVALPSACSPSPEEESVDLDPVAVVLESGETRELDLQVELDLDQDSSVDSVDLVVGALLPTENDDSAADDDGTLAGVYLRLADNQGHASDGDLDGTEDGVGIEFNVCDADDECGDRTHGACRLENTGCIMDYTITLANGADGPTSLDLVVSADMTTVWGDLTGASMTLTVE